MTTLVDYTIVTDPHFDLSTNGNKSWEKDFAIPPGAPSFNAILSFNLLPTSGCNAVLVVELNDRKVFQGTVKAPAGTNEFRAVNEVISLENPPVMKNGSNHLEFKLTGGAGQMTIADVILWTKHQG